jgi:hypothetical protein
LQIHRRSTPRQQFTEPVDLVIMDAVEDACQTGPQIETISLAVSVTVIARAKVSAPASPP